MTAKEKAIHDAGSVSVLASLHVATYSSVLAAYGWRDVRPPRDEAVLLDRLFAFGRAQQVGGDRYSGV